MSNPTKPQRVHVYLDPKTALLAARLRLADPFWTISAEVRQAIRRAAGKIKSA